MSKCDFEIIFNNFGLIVLFIIYTLWILLFLLSTINLISISKETYDNPLEYEQEYDKYSYFKNFTKNNMSILLNNNYDECEKLKIAMISENSSLSDIFELNIGSIHSSSISIIINNFFIFTFGCLLLVIYRLCFQTERDTECCDCRSICDLWYTFVFACIMVICLIVNIIEFASLCGVYNNNDSDNFFNFIDCYNVNKDAFEKYSILNDLSSHFTLVKIYHTLFIIYIAIFIVISIIIKLYCPFYSGAKENTFL